MKATVSTIEVIQSFPCTSLVIPLPSTQTETLLDLKKKADEGKLLHVEIKAVRKQRSLSANGYLWHLLGEMAAVLKTSKDELYLEMLDRYGVYTHMVVKPNAVERTKAVWKTARELGEVTVNGQRGIQLQCYYGSSTYNTKEFTRLLDGVISEAKEIGVEVVTEADRALMLEEWGK